MRELATLILAAGKGKRMKSEKPKVVFELAQKPLIQRVIETAQKVESDRIIAVVGHKKELVMQSLFEFDNIKYVVQKEQKGTGHAVMVARKALQKFIGDVFILCGDVPLLQADTLKRMLSVHREQKAACTILTAVMDDPKQYGRIVRDENGAITGIVEYKDATDKQRQINEINTGIYCFDCKELFAALDKITTDNKQGELYLTDTVKILAEENKPIANIVLEDMLQASGVNSQEELDKLEQAYYKRLKTKS